MSASSGATPAEIRLVARSLVQRSWANTKDRSARTAPARAAADARFERQVDPEGVLDPAERAKRADHARRAWYAQMSARALQARRARKAADKPFDAANTPRRVTGHKDGCQLPEDHASECRRASSPNGRS